MKKTIIILISFLAIAANTFGQTKTSKEENIKEQIIALDKSGWEAWKNNTAEWFQNNTTEEFLSINAEGVSNKAQVVKSIAADCDVKSFSLDNFKFVMLNENTVLLTYIATQDGVCGGNKLTSKIRATVNYVKRGGKWLEALYMETPSIE